MMLTGKNDATITSFPVLINNKKKEHKQLHWAIGDVLDCLQDYLDEHGKHDNNSKVPFDDEECTRTAGEKVREACGALRFWFEAFTTSLTEVGEINNAFVVTTAKKFALGRHKDGPNDCPERLQKDGNF